MSSPLVRMCVLPVQPGRWREHMPRKTRRPPPTLPTHKGVCPECGKALEIPGELLATSALQRAPHAERYTREEQWRDLRRGYCGHAPPRVA